MRTPPRGFNTIPKSRWPFVIYTAPFPLPSCPSAHAASKPTGRPSGRNATQVEADPEGLDAVVQANQDGLDACGHWGVPTLAFEGEPFFGQDRIDLAVWTMKKAGLKPRG